MKMEHYKNNMAECTHSGAWQENMFGRICQDCGFDTFCNDYGMYDEVGKSKGFLNKIRTEGAVLFIGTDSYFKHLEYLKSLKQPFNDIDIISPLMEVPQFEKEIHLKLKNTLVELDEEMKVLNHNGIRLGTEQKKYRKGNNKKYAKRKRR